MKCVYEVRGEGEIFLGPMDTKYVNLALLPLVSIIIGAANKNNFSQASSVGETLEKNNNCINYKKWSDIEQKNINAIFKGGWLLVINAVL